MHNTDLLQTDPGASHDVRLLKRLLECAQHLNSTLDLRQLTQVILAIIHEELDFERATVFVVDSEKRILRSFVAEGVDQFEITLNLGAGVAGTVAETGELLDIPVASLDTRFQSTFDERLGYKTRDVYCMPIRKADRKCVGVLQLLNRRREITENDKQFLISISSHLAIALERAWFHHQMQEKHRMEQEMSRVQSELAQLERLSLVGTLTSGLVHEVRNPLSILLAHTAMMKENPELTDELAARLAIIEYSAQRTMDVVKNFLTFSGRDDGGLRAPANINDTIRKTLDLLEYECRKHNVRLIRDLGKVPTLRINVGQIQQVLLNLVKNAIDAISQSEQGGAICILSRLSSDGKAVRVEVTDDGPGIREEHQARLFEPFFTSKRDGLGTGLGLSTSRRLIENHGGRIDFRTDPDAGTTFWFELPRVTEHEASAVVEMARMDAATSGFTNRG